MNDEAGGRERVRNGAAWRLDVAQPLESSAPVKWKIVVSGSFTVDPLVRPLEFWTRALQIPAELELAPYGQLLRELIDPESQLAGNHAGFNLLLVRLQDWGAPNPSERDDAIVSQVRSVAAEFAGALERLQARTGATTLVYVCPTSSELPIGVLEAIGKLEEDLIRQLKAAKRVHCWTHADLMRLYPVDEHEDSRADHVGHIPYTDRYFVAIATLLARRITVSVKPQFKVIAVDCDNTLWKGVCGEDGPDQVEITRSHLRLQQLLLEQYNAGMLLCLCSKNNAEDVDAVFRRNDMLLRPEHFVAGRVNWESKSSNLNALAQELGLALDSFVFIDDSDVECAEVQAAYPSVLTLHMPSNEDEVTRFIEHTWAFDRTEVTEEAKKRTAQYRENRAREAVVSSSTELSDFLANLRLEVHFFPMRMANAGRVAELIQRTNQFNLSGIRRRTGEVEALWSSGQMRILVVEVRDRFGDYGVVGAVLFKCVDNTVDVDTFVLSCRALGRGVEHKIVNELGRIAADESLDSILLRYRPLPRNEPARRFLEQSLGAYKVESFSSVSGEVLFRVPTDRAIALVPRGSAREAVTEPPGRKAGTGAPPNVASPTWHHFAYRLSRLDDVVRAMRPIVSRKQVRASDFAEPQTEIEKVVAGIWAELLGISEVGLHDDLFDLGGDSLTAVRAVSQIESRLDLNLDLRELFEGASVQRISAKLSDATRAVSSIRAFDRSGPLLASWSQQRLWFIDQLENGSTAYHIGFAVRIRGELSEAALHSALDRMLERHESLRTVFITEGGLPLQKICGTVDFALRKHELSMQSYDELEKEVKRLSRELVEEPFDLSSGPLVRGALVRVAATEHLLLIAMHHIVSDGWSVNVFLRELGLLYTNSLVGSPVALPSLPIQYADYAQWQHQCLAAGTLQLGLEYWTSHLRGAPDLLELPTDRCRPLRQSYRGGNARIQLDAAATEKLKTFARRNDLTLAMCLSAAWFIVLSKLSGQQDIVVGMPVANRRRSELEGLIGFFVNTLAVRLRLDGDPSLLELCGRVKQVLLDGYTYQDTPFEKIVEVLQPTRSMSHSPVFQALFVLHNTPYQPVEIPRAEWIREDVSQCTAQFDLSLAFEELPEGMVGRLNYATDLFEAETIDRWCGYYVAALNALIDRGETCIDALELMSDDERRKILTTFQGQRDFYPEGLSIHELFEEQVARDPARVAVVYDRSRLTYGDLSLISSRISRVLLDAGVRTDDRVALHAERSVEMLAGIIGIWKAGAAYVPMDPSYPIERQRFTLNDSRPKAVLTQKKLRNLLPLTTAAIVEIDHYMEVVASARPGSVTENSAGRGGNPLAYVIYTSGSTGQPKGVMIEHRHVLNLYHGLKKLYAEVRCPACVALNASFNFDASVQQIMQLLAGHSLFVISDEVRRDAAQLLAYARENQIEAIDCTPSQLKLWLEAGLIDDHTCPIRVVLTGGEAISYELWNRLSKFRNIQFYNVYGPTECTVDATAAPAQGDTTTPHIGRPMQNRRVYVVDERGRLAPIGVRGEIYIGGDGVGRGYLHRASATADRFVADCCSDQVGARAYRTGDLGRWRADGIIEYLGRNDGQVKLRGFRIELGEIESQLRRHKHVKDAAVVVRREGLGEQRLVAYVERGSAVEEELKPDALRQHLKVLLPEHMMPSAFVIMERLPVSPSGKLDRNALPSPDLNAYAVRTYEAPRDDVEMLLASIWQSLLNVSQVGRNDNFFELGGHSLLIVKMLQQLRRVGLYAEVRSVFEAPTIAGLAHALIHATHQVAVPPNRIPEDCREITPDMLPLATLTPDEIQTIVSHVPGGAANIKDIFPLAPLQEGLLFHHMMDDGGADGYVAPILFKIASRERLRDFIAALQAMVDRHDVLRTAIHWEQLSGPVQVVHRHASVPVEELGPAASHDAHADTGDWLSAQKQRLDLRKAPLLALKFTCHANTGECDVLLLQHHIVSDNISQELILRELINRLGGETQTSANVASYRDHVARTIEYARSNSADKFFREKLADVEEATAPFGLMDVRSGDRRKEEARLDFETGLSRRVRMQARRLGVSAATLFHAAWALVVARTSGRDDVVFGTVLLGRLQEAGVTERTLGMFINTLPIRLRLSSIGARTLVERTQVELIELLSHEQASLALAQRCSGIVGSTPVFTALLNYRHNAKVPDADWIRAQGVRAVASQGFTNYPITMSVDDLGEGFALTAQTARELNPHRIAGYLHVAMSALVGSLESDLNFPALSLAVLSEEEVHQVVHSFNRAKAAYPRSRLIHELFEDEVLRTPTATALIHGDLRLSYSELNSLANRITEHLIGSGVKAGDLVGVCLERGTKLIASLIGVLKAGAAYVPLDPSYPLDRLRFMLDDAKPRAVLAERSTVSLLPDEATPILLDTEFSGAESQPAAAVSSAAVAATSDAILYVIYTSGSTGRPKGTAMTHRAMTNLIEWHRREFNKPQRARVLQFAAVSFDVAFQEIFSTLCHGGALVMLDEWMRRDVKALFELISGAGVGRLFVPPLMLQSLAEHCLDQSEAPLALHDVITAGEQLRITPEIVNWFRHMPNCRLHNHYGPTETHVATALTLPPDPNSWPAVPTIGRPLPNLQIFVLDPQLQPVPVGVIGEIHIAGANLGTGYLHRGELTAQRFIANCFGSHGERMYRTGDLGRWLADGSIEYLGRNDDQVKIRGYRIELGEIEASLATHPCVREAIVIAGKDESGNMRLVGYVTTRDASKPSPKDLAVHLKMKLPDHMVPSAFVVIDKLPLTQSGKLNRRALPAPDFRCSPHEGYEPPAGATEQALAHLWKDVLRLERVGRQDNFFELGGHSLLAMRVSTRAHRELGVDIPVRLLFEYPTLNRLAACIEARSGGFKKRHEDIEALMRQVSSMSEEEAQQLLDELTLGERQ